MAEDVTVHKPRVHRIRQDRIVSRHKPGEAYEGEGGREGKS